MIFSEELKQIIEKYYGTNEEMDKKGEMERNRVFAEVYKEAALILERDYNYILQIIPIKVK